MTIAAVLDHRLAEAQRLGLRVKEIILTTQEVPNAYEAVRGGLIGTEYRGIPVRFVNNGVPDDYAQTL